MRTRKIVRQENRWDVVWFKSYGLNTTAAYTFTREHGTISDDTISFTLSIPANTNVIIQVTAKQKTIYAIREAQHHVLEMGRLEEGENSITLDLPNGMDRLYLPDSHIDWNFPITIFAGTAKKTDSNYSEEDENVADSLQQRLSVIRGELFYNIIHGVPLSDKVNKIVIDTSIMSIVNAHPEVTGIVNFESEQIGDKYSAQLQISTIYGTVNLSV